MPSHEADSWTIDEFFDAYRRYICTESAMYPPLSRGGLPQEAYEPLERELGVRLPWSFKEWHGRYHSRGMQVQGMYLPLSPDDVAVSDLKDRILALDHLAEGLARHIVPFGYDEITGRVAAFDARKPVDGDDWPVVFVPRPRGDGAGPAVADPEHPSFADLLAGLTRVIEQTLDPEEP